MPAPGPPWPGQLLAGCPDLAPEERAALTPLAKLAAERVKAAPKEDPDGYWASMEAEAPPEEEWSPDAAGYDAPGATGTARGAPRDDVRAGTAPPAAAV